MYVYVHMDNICSQFVTLLSIVWRVINDVISAHARAYMMVATIWR